MSTHALSTSGPAAAAERGGRDVLGFVDIAVLVAALPVFLLAHFPMLGYGACAAAWICQRLLYNVLARSAARADNPRNVAGLLILSMITRVWMVALAILAAGLVEREAGLSGAVLAAVLFQVYFVTLFVRRTGEAAK